MGIKETITLFLIGLLIGWVFSEPKPRKKNGGRR